MTHVVIDYENLDRISQELQKNGGHILDISLKPEKNFPQVTLDIFQNPIIYSNPPRLEYRNGSHPDNSRNIELIRTKIHHTDRLSGVVIGDYELFIRRQLTGVRNVDESIKEGILTYVQQGKTIEPGIRYLLREGIKKINIGLRKKTITDGELEEIVRQIMEDQENGILAQFSLDLVLQDMKQN